MQLRVTEGEVRRIKWLVEFNFSFFTIGKSPKEAYFTFFFAEF